MENLNWDFDNSCFVFWCFFSRGVCVSVLAIGFYFWRNEKKMHLIDSFEREVGVYFAGEWEHSRGFKSVCTQPQTKDFKVKFDWAQPFSDIESWSWMICIMYKDYILTHNKQNSNSNFGVFDIFIQFLSLNILKDLAWKQIFPKKN